MAYLSNKTGSPNLLLFLKYQIDIPDLIQPAALLEKEGGYQILTSVRLVIEHADTI